MRGGERARLFDLRPGELGLSLAMGAHFFLVIATFWVLKPLKKGLLVEHYHREGLFALGLRFDAAQAEMLGKVGNMALALAAALAFGWLSRRMRRERLTLVVVGVVGALFITFAFGLAGAPKPTTVWAFYVYGDLYATLMVATFFAFLNDVATPAMAKRLYGIVVFGGVAGGAFGSGVLRLFVDALSPSGWMIIGLVTTSLVGGIALLVGSRAPPATPLEVVDAKSPARGLLAGARLVASSRYLLSIAALVALYEIISTILDFQFTATVAHHLEGPAISRHFATVFSITNGVALAVQIVLTSWVMRRFSVGAALLCAPALILGASALFLVLPLLLTASALSVVDNASNYSIHQSARESLYTPLGRAEKYEAKAFIDMFLQRAAKVLAVGVSLVVTMLFRDYATIRWLSLIVLAAGTAWAFAAFYAGRRFRSHEARREGGPE